MKIILAQEALRDELVTIGLFDSNTLHERIVDYITAINDRNDDDTYNPDEYFEFQTENGFKREYPSSNNNGMFIFLRFSEFELNEINKQV